MKIAAFFFLTLISAQAGVSVCVNFGMDKNGSMSPTAELYCLDATGTVTTFSYRSLSSTWPLLTDGCIVIKGTPWYCGKGGADALFLYACNTNQ